MSSAERVGPPPFHVELHPDRQRVLVSPAGELDLATAPALERAILDLLAEGFGHVVIDLRDLWFIDSSGLRVLLVAHAAATERGARVSLLPGRDEAVRRPLELAGLLDHLDLVDR